MKKYKFENADSLSVVEFDTRLSLLESNFQKFCDIQADIEQVCDTEIEFESRTLAEDLYCEIKSKILSDISKRNQRVEHLVDPNDSIGYVGNNSSLPSPRITKLPKLKLPTFSGLVGIIHL